MIREICKAEVFLAQKAEAATADDLNTAQDLLDTLIAHKDGCVGMAANMIGVNKRIIAFENDGEYMLMFNPVIVKKSGAHIQYEADPKLRDFENVHLKEDVQIYFEREVRPHVPDAWIEHEKTKVGYEINFNRHFYRFTPPRPLAEIDADLKKAEEEILRLLREVTT